MNAISWILICGLNSFDDGNLQKDFTRVFVKRTLWRSLTQMKQGKVVPLGGSLAIRAAETSHRYKLSLADGIIVTTAMEWSAKLLTQDADIEGLPGVEYFRHPKRRK